MKPSVVTDVAGTKEEVTNEETGFVVPPGDPNALAAALLKLLDDPVMASRFGAAAYQHYLEMFCPEDVARQIESIFLEIARHSGRGSPRVRHSKSATSAPCVSDFHVLAPSDWRSEALR